MTSIISSALRFQNVNFDPGLPRYKNGANRLGRIKLHENDHSAFFATMRETLRRELESILEGNDD